MHEPVLRQPPASVRRQTIVSHQDTSDTSQPPSLRRSRALSTALAVVLAAGAFACATTTFQSTWKAPDAQPLQFRGQKVLAVFVSSNEAVRHRAETTMARELSNRGAEGTPSFTLLSQAEVKDMEPAKRKVEAAGFAGAVVMRVVDRDTEYSYSPATVWAVPRYRRFWGGYWGWGWGHMWEPGYIRADRVIVVETLIYSMRQDQLVWAAVSRTVNPDRVEGLIADLAAAASKELKKEGLVTGS